jgi:hypothetical protein
MDGGVSQSGKRGDVDFLYPPNGLSGLEMLPRWTPSASIYILDQTFLPLVRPACQPQAPTFASKPHPSPTPTHNLLHRLSQETPSFSKPIFGQFLSSIGGLVVKLAVAI